MAPWGVFFAGYFFGVLTVLVLSVIAVLVLLWRSDNLPKVRIVQTLSDDAR